MSGMSSLSTRLFSRWAPVALALALMHCGSSEDSADGGGSTGLAGKNGGKAGAGGNGSGSNGSGSNGQGSTGSGANGQGSNGQGSNGSGGGINIGGNGGGVDCNRKDGKVDQQGCSCDVGKTQACYTGDPKLAGLGLCKLGSQACIPAKKTQGEVGPDNVWGPCSGSGAPQAEVCDDVDQNCNGDIKEGCACKDKDTEGCATASGDSGKRTCVGGTWGACTPDTTTTCTAGKTEGCTTAAGQPGKKTCEGGTWGACTPDNTTVCTPGANEPCTTADGKAGKKTCSPAGAWGACVPGDTTVCTPGATEACTAPDGSLGTKTCGPSGAWGGCSSSSGSCVPSPEVCDGLDNDCDGKVDGFNDKTGCDVECPGGGERSCLSGSYTKCTCGCVEQACSTLCGPGIKKCVDGVLGACQVPPVEQICLCADGSQGTASCANGQVGACNCNQGGGGSSGGGGSTGGTPCETCITTECSYEKIAAASQSLGNDTSQCKAWYDNFVECVKANPGSNYFNGPCDQAIGGCDGNCGCGNIIRLAADCASTGNGVGVGQLAKPGGCTTECQ